VIDRVGAHAIRDVLELKPSLVDLPGINWNVRAERLSESARLETAYTRRIKLPTSAKGDGGHLDRRASHAMPYAIAAAAIAKTPSQYPWRLIRRPLLENERLAYRAPRVVPSAVRRNAGRYLSGTAFAILALPLAGLL